MKTQFSNLITGIIAGLSLASLGCTSSFSSSSLLGPIGQISSSSLETGADSSPQIDPQFARLPLAGSCTTNCPAITLTSPKEYQVTQRDQTNNANIEIKGAYAVGNSLIRVQVQSSTGTIIYDQFLQPQNSSDTVNFTVTAKLPGGGWYQLLVQEVSKDKTKVLSQAQVFHFGVGEVFITAGQSNASLSGQKVQPSPALGSGGYLGADGQVNWVNSVDFNSTTYGSPWPVFASYMVEKFQVPIGILQVACGGTNLLQWLPKNQGAIDASYCGTDAASPGALYQRLVNGVKGLGSFRALLWHQGESDAVNGTTMSQYQSRLSLIMNQLNQDTGRSGASAVVWFIANASYYPGSEIDPTTCNLKGAPTQYYANMSQIRYAQQSFWGSGLAKVGPDTDGMIGSIFRYPGADGYCVHFSDTGLKVHGLLWYVKVSESQMIPGSDSPSTDATVGLYRYHSASDHFISTGNADLSAYGYTLEGLAMNAYAQPSGTQAVGLYRCIYNGVAHFLSIDPNCEGFQIEGLIAYMRNSPSVGTSTVYRFYSPGPTVDILTTLSLDEGFGAGYILVGPQAYAPR